MYQKCPAGVKHGIQGTAKTIERFATEGDIIDKTSVFAEVQLFNTHVYNCLHLWRA